MLNSDDNPSDAGISLAISRAGGCAALARALNLTRGAVWQWKRGTVPASRVPTISDLTGVPRHALRPDLWAPPAASRKQPHPAPPAQVGRAGEAA